MAVAEGSEVDTAAETAKEYASERLRDAAQRLSPKKLAEEYGCSNPHMRDCLRELMEEGEIERPDHGEYIHSEAAEASDEDNADAADAPLESAGDEGGSSGMQSVDEAGAAAAAGATAVTMAPAFLFEDDGSVDWWIVGGIVLIGAILVLARMGESGEGSEQAQPDDDDESGSGREEGGLV